MLENKAYIPDVQDKANYLFVNYIDRGWTSAQIRRHITGLLNKRAIAIMPTLFSKSLLPADASIKELYGAAVHEGTVLVKCVGGAGGGKNTASNANISIGEPVCFDMFSGSAVTGINPNWKPNEYKVIGIALASHSGNEYSTIPVQLNPEPPPPVGVTVGLLPDTEREQNSELSPYRWVQISGEESRITQIWFDASHGLAQLNLGEQVDDEPSESGAGGVVSGSGSGSGSEEESASGSGAGSASGSGSGSGSGEGLAFRDDGDGFQVCKKQQLVNGEYIDVPGVIRIDLSCQSQDSVYWQRPRRAVELEWAGPSAGRPLIDINPFFTAAPHIHYLHMGRGSNEDTYENAPEVGPYTGNIVFWSGAEAIRTTTYVPGVGDVTTTTEGSSATGFGIKAGNTLPSLFSLLGNEDSGAGNEGTESISGIGSGDHEIEQSPGPGSGIEDSLSGDGDGQAGVTEIGGNIQPSYEIRQHILPIWPPYNTYDFVVNAGNTLLNGIVIGNNLDGDDEEEIEEDVIQEEEEIAEEEEIVEEEEEENMEQDSGTGLGTTDGGFITGLHVTKQALVIERYTLDTPQSAQHVVMGWGTTLTMAEFRPFGFTLPGEEAGEESLSGGGGTNDTHSHGGGLGEDDNEEEVESGDGTAESDSGDGRGPDSDEESLSGEGDLPDQALYHRHDVYRIWVNQASGFRLLDKVDATGFPVLGEVCLSLLPTEPYSVLAYPHDFFGPINPATTYAIWSQMPHTVGIILGIGKPAEDSGSGGGSEDGGSEEGSGGGSGEGSGGGSGEGGGGFIPPLAEPENGVLIIHNKENMKSVRVAATNTKSGYTVNLPEGSGNAKGQIMAIKAHNIDDELGEEVNNMDWMSLVAASVDPYSASPGDSLDISHPDYPQLEATEPGDYNEPTLAADNADNTNTTKWYRYNRLEFNGADFEISYKANSRNLRDAEGHIIAGTIAINFDRRSTIIFTKMINSTSYQNYTMVVPEGFNCNETGGVGTIDKTAIVPYNEEYVSLFCTESPEVRFEDIIEIPVSTVNQTGTVGYKLDDTFLGVCEPGSVKAVSAVASEPAMLGVKTEDGVVLVKYQHFQLGQIDFTVTVKVSGIRLGRAGKRFTRATAEQFRNNNTFYSMAHDGMYGR